MFREDQSYLLVPILNVHEYDSIVIHPPLFALNK